MSLMTISSVLYNQILIALVVFPVLIIVIWGILPKQKRKIGSLLWIRRGPPHVVSTNSKDPIEPLEDFDIWKVEPISYRPYRSSRHVSLGVTQKPRNEWIHLDRGYLVHIQERERLIQQYPEATVCTGPLVNPAIEELYLEIMINYLPHRYPTIFKTSGNVVHNVVTGTTYPLSTAGLTPERMLQLLGVNVEDDFFFMCPDENDGEFRLRGCIACFPNGFLGPAHLGQSVREIHRAVPGYEERLGNGVDRYFQRMSPGQFVGRMNWSLQVDGPDLFRTDGLNYYPDSVLAVSKAHTDPDFDKCFLRVEHQTLTCLPRSKAIMFCVRSYMTPLQEIKNEGEGPRLAEAIESMPEKLGLYKMRQFWGGKVLPWLKEGPDTAPSTVA